MAFHMKVSFILCMMAAVHALRLGENEQTNATGQKMGREKEQTNSTGQKKMGMPNLYYFSIYGITTGINMCLWNAEEGLIDSMFSKTWKEWKGVLLRALKKPCPVGGKRSERNVFSITEQAHFDLKAEDICSSCAGPTSRDNVEIILGLSSQESRGLFTERTHLKTGGPRAVDDDKALIASEVRAGFTRMLLTYPKPDDRGEVMKVQSRHQQPLQDETILGNEETSWISSEESEMNSPVDKSMMTGERIKGQKFTTFNLFQIGVKGQ